MCVFLFRYKNKIKILLIKYCKKKLKQLLHWPPTGKKENFTGRILFWSVEKNALSKKKNKKVYVGRQGVPEI